MTLGETLVCFTSAGSRLPATSYVRKSVGGTESNTAIGLARLGHSVAWISRVGEDPFGQEILRTLRGEGVDVSRVRRREAAQTGLMVKEFRTSREIHVYYYREGSAASTMDEHDVPEELIANAGRVHLTGITLALGPGPARAVHRTAQLCREHAVPLSFDPNHRRKLWTDRDAVLAWEELYPFVDDLLISEEELLLASPDWRVEDAVSRLHELGIRRVVVRRGAEGASGFHNGESLDVPAVPVDVVDTVGAGDAFNAGYLHGMMAGQPFKQALETGAWVASRVVAHRGDYEGLPQLDEYETRGGLPASATR